MATKKMARYRTGLWLTKDNRLIRMRGNMTSLSYKLTNYFLWLSMKEGRLDNLQITASELKSILQYKKTGLKDLLKEESEKIMRTIIELENNSVEEKWEQMTLIPYMKYENGVVTAKINPDLLPYISGLTGNYTQTNYAMLNSCSYAAMRLAEVCNSWAYVGYAYYSVDEWRALLGATKDSYKAMSQFRRRILNPAIKDVSERMDYTLTPIEIKKNRTVTHIKMVIEKKSFVSAGEALPPKDEHKQASAKPENRPSKQKDPSQQPAVTEWNSLTPAEEDVVARMVSNYEYDEAKAVNAVKQYGAAYCQEQMETVRQAIKSAKMSGREIRSKGGYLNEALKNGYAQINKALENAKQAEQAEAEEIRQWDRQARGLCTGKEPAGPVPALQKVIDMVLHTKDEEHRKKLEKWEKERGELRKELLAAMIAGEIDLADVKKGMDEFEAACPMPIAKTPSS